MLNIDEINKIVKNVFFQFCFFFRQNRKLRTIKSYITYRYLIALFQNLIRLLIASIKILQNIQIIYD